MLLSAYLIFLYGLYALLFKQFYLDAAHMGCFVVDVFLVVAVMVSRLQGFLLSGKGEHTTGSAERAE